MPERSEPVPAASLEETLSVRAGSAEVLDAVRELSAQVSGLRADVNTLRAQAQPLPAAGEPPGWDANSRDSLAWVRALEGPGSRHAPVPWLLLEITFLAAVAVGTAVADLDWQVVVGAMAGAWALVALGEWVRALAARRRAEAAFAPVAVYGQGFAADPSWFAPPVERTALVSEDTGALLPPPAEDLE